MDYTELSTKLINIIINDQLRKCICFRVIPKWSENAIFDNFGII
jgi:hypothetical protein